MGFTLIGRSYSKRDNRFRERLSNVAGFKFVADPLPMRNKKRAVVYYLFFASPKPVAAKIIEGIPQRTLHLWRAFLRHYAPTLIDVGQGAICGARSLYASSAGGREEIAS